MRPVPFPSQDIEALFGEVRPVIRGNPGNATEYVYTVGDGYYMRVFSWCWQLVTSAQAANRFPGYQISDGNGSSIYLARLTGATTLSTTVTISSSPWCPLLVGSNAALAYCIQMPAIWLWPGCIIATTAYTTGGTGNQLQSNDHYGFSNLYLETLDRDTVEQYYGRNYEPNMQEDALTRASMLEVSGGYQ